jgi:RNA polymerase sigma factor (TIGR02999 family)
MDSMSILAPERANLPEAALRRAGGEQAGIDRLLPLIYQELRRLAGSYLRNQASNSTLQPTALVHEAYIRLVNRVHSGIEDRAHFVRLAATVMRQILVDRARERVAAKRGGGQIRVEFDENWSHSDEKSQDVVALDDALKGLAIFDERKSRVLELRYFGGLSVEETAQALDVSVATIGRETRYAEAWLRRELSGKRCLAQTA